MKTKAKKRLALAKSAKVAAFELGCPGHFIGARSCQFRRHTQIGGAYAVSTVGDYLPPLFGERSDGGRQTLGAAPDSFFETMVFPTFDRAAGNNEGCGCRERKDWSGLEQVRYATAGEAQVGHEAMVTKYLQLARAAFR